METKMIKLQLDMPMVGLDNKPLTNNETCSKILASQLASSQKGDAIKMWDWAIALYKTGTITVDRADLDYLIKFVKENEQLLVLAKAQLLNILKVAE